MMRAFKGSCCKNILIVSMMLCFRQFSFSQVIPVEVTVGNNSYYYQHTFMKKFSESSKFGFFNTSSILSFHEKGAGSEIMSQIYMTYSISKSFTVGLGSIYAGPGLRPSASFQFYKMSKSTFIMVAPRVSIWDRPSFELMSMFEYRPEINKKLFIYSRIQVMMTWGMKNHERSYQYVRLGLDNHCFQFGAAVNFDKYGPEAESKQNYGLFIRKEI